MTRVGVLASGGLDSSVLMRALRRERMDVLPIHVNYGQLAERREWRSLQAFCRFTKLDHPVKVNAEGVRLIPSGLTRARSRWQADPFLPARNLILVSIGSGVAYSRGIRALAIGLTANALYPDTTPDFVAAATGVLRESFGARFTLIAPFLKFDKPSVVKLGRRLRAPLELTYSCQTGRDPPCGTCSSCIDRATALARPKPLDPKSKVLADVAEG